MRPVATGAHLREIGDGDRSSVDFRSQRVDRSMEFTRTAVGFALPEGSRRRL